MVGLAQRLFSERAGKVAETAAHSLLSVFHPVDLSLAKLLLKPFPQADERVMAFICYLSAAMRSGHLCIEISEKGLAPDLALLDVGEETAKLESAIVYGGQNIPLALSTGQNSPLIREKERIYFRRYWMAEKSCFRRFLELLKQEPEIQIPQQLIEERGNCLIRDGILLPEQAEALSKAAAQCLTLISGGPGTGKTYTLRHLLRLFLQAMPPSTKIALAAPTGKAANHLEKTLGLNLQVTTLHSLLEMNREIGSQLALGADLIIVDESSMIDLNMMTCLLSKIKPGARLILVGDPYQLSPVDSGTLFADFIDYCVDHQKHLLVLKKSLRTELETIVTLAEEIRKGDVFKVLSLLEQKKQQGIIYRPFEEEEEVQKELVEGALAYFDSLLEGYDQLEQMNGFRLLSPIRKGPLGVDTLNRLCLSAIQRKWGKCLNSPIILTKSDKRLGLFNGQTGILINGERALFPGRESEGLRSIPISLLPSYEYAYCLSVYKSQGSEFDEVWIALPKGGERFGREVLYTAVTRARAKVQLWGSKETIEQTLKRSARRLSGIRHLA